MYRLIAIVAFCCLLASPAAAKHHRRHIEPNQPQISGAELIICNQQGCSRQNGVMVIRVNEKHRHSRAQRHAAQIDRAALACCTNLVARARAYNGMTAGQIGLHRRSQWCMAFLRHIGVEGPVDDRAISALRLPHVPPQIGAIAVYAHHVGIVTGFDRGYPVLISGNSNGRRVYEGTYPRHPIAYVMG